MKRLYNVISILYNDLRETNMNEKNKGNQDEFDIFIANSIFPEAASIFSTHIKTIKSIKNTAIIVMDTNALLVPYNVGKDSVSQIRTTYEKLVKTGQLIIPGQVAREFANNRTNKILTLFQQLTRKQNSITNLQKGKYPLLESLPEYKEAIRLEEEIDRLIKEYRKTISSVLDHIRSWRWDDPVSRLYADLFTEEIVFDLSIDQDNMKKELKKRQIHKIPPGYKDASKDDSGIGDLLIWFTILEIGRSKSKDVIFVSGDEKPDWWDIRENQSIYPRYELIDEFRRKSGGYSFHIIHFSQFLDLYGASESAVEEVREEESKLSTEFSLIGEFIHKWQILERTLLSKCSLIEPNLPDRWRMNLREVADQLYRQRLVDKMFVLELQELNIIRNLIVHKGESEIDKIPSEIKEIILRLDILIDIASKISFDNVD